VNLIPSTCINALVWVNAIPPDTMAPPSFSALMIVYALVEPFGMFERNSLYVLFPMTRVSPEPIQDIPEAIVFLGVAFERADEQLLGSLPVVQPVPHAAPVSHT
jgi:hypothetical protein